MIEFILGAFLWAKFKKKYKLLPALKDWGIWIPLSFALLYIFCEVCVFYRWYWFLPYQHVIKYLTLLSYAVPVFRFKLYDSFFDRCRVGFIKQKYKKSIVTDLVNGFLNCITSPFALAVLFNRVGSMLNTIVVRANGNRMPVFPTNSIWSGYTQMPFPEDGLHVLGDFTSKIIPLCDVYDVFYSVWSIGDILIRFYAFVIIYYSIKYKNNFCFSVDK